MSTTTKGRDPWKPTEQQIEAIVTGDDEQFAAVFPQSTRLSGDKREMNNGDIVSVIQHFCDFLTDEKRIGFVQLSDERDTRPRVLNMSECNYRDWALEFFEIDPKQHANEIEQMIRALQIANQRISERTTPAK